MKFKIIPVLFTLTLIMISGIPFESAFADATSGEIFYTRFSGSDRVEKRTVSYDGVSTLTVGPATVIATSAQMAAAPGSGGTSGADGIIGNPNDPASLIVGGQSTDRLFRVLKAGGVVSATPVGTDAYHLEGEPDIGPAGSVYVSNIPGALARVALNADGTIGSSTAITLVGHDTQVTQIIKTPSGYYYTRSGSGGNGVYGTITFVGNTGTTTRLHAAAGTFGGPAGSVGILNLPATHGGVYDPYTNKVITFGDNFMTQFDLAGNIVSTLDITGKGTNTPGAGSFQLDQGTVDGAGHVFAACNCGNLYFVDYRASGLVGAATNFIENPFLGSSLDDIAPLTGFGTTEEPVGGSILPIDTVALLVAGIQSMTIWIAPVLAGAAGTAAFYLKTRKN